MRLSYLFSRAGAAPVVPQVAAALALFWGGLAPAAPFKSATITKTENRIFLSEREADRSSRHPAAVQDVMDGGKYLLSESQSRAELQYPDGTLVRVGQNTIFTFDEGTRTLSLDRGSLLFHIPKGTGGGTIKTASLTAAITGTAGKVSANIIAIVEGEIKLVPSGRAVKAGEFARKNADGSITIAPFDPASVLEGKLVDFNGIMPGFPSTLPAEDLVENVPGLPASSPPNAQALVMDPPDLRTIEVQTRTQNLPGSIEHFFPRPPVKVVKKEEERPAENQPTRPAPTPRPTPRATPRSARPAIRKSRSAPPPPRPLASGPADLAGADPSSPEEPQRHFGEAG